MRRLLAAIPPLLLLSACGLNGTDGDTDKDETAASSDRAGADSMASNDPAPGKQADVDVPDAEPRPMMQAQVVLERLGFGPGVIDGQSGLSTTNALTAFQEANGLQVTGELDEASRQALSRWGNIQATRVVTIPQEWGSVRYQPIPDDPAAQAKMEQLGYESLDEALAERFHTTVEVLRQLNPGGQPAGAAGTRTASPAPVSPTPSGSASATPAPMFRAGQQVRVPNIGADQIDPASVDNPDWLRTLASLGVGTRQPEVARIVVDKSGGWLKAYDESDKLVAAFTVSSGSEHDPLPLGDWGVKGVAYNPRFSYDPELFWDVPDSEEEQDLPPGPNGSVGVVWIDLTKEHYGIHGTPAPETIGRAQSHGCVRLTNWDAARLAQMVSGSTKVLFQA